MIRLDGLSPSHYGVFTGRPSQEYLMAHELVKEYLQAWRDYGGFMKSGHRSRVEIQTWVDQVHLDKLPQMLRTCEALGVDGVRFENYVSSNEHVRASRSLLTEDGRVQKALRELRRTNTYLRIQLPHLVDRHPTPRRGCRALGTAIGVTPNTGEVNPCITQQVVPQTGVHLWEVDFLNHSVFQWLTAVHHNGPFDVPEACTLCPHGAATTPPEVLNEYPERVRALSAAEPA